jgi:mRNA interferase MazF
MEKYNEWNKVKQNINKKDRCFYVKPREVAWIHLGENVGDEENGKGENFQRPVMVLKVFNKNIFFGIPLSTKIKNSNKYYFEALLISKTEDNSHKVLKSVFQENTRSVMLTHARLYDTKRVIGHVGYIKKEDFEKIKIAFKAMF